MVEVVFSGVADGNGVQGTLFQGIKFWISHKVPQRSRFLTDVQVNGGEVIPLEKNADVKIVDHARKEAPPGSHSYTFIEKSIRNGILEDLDDHKVGPPEGNIRSIGSVMQPAKGTRNRYTEKDDRILWHWVNDNPQKGGGTDGNEIYKQLEKKHPQHPWQSWRDRWIKHLKGTKAPFPLPHNAPPTPPLDVPSAAETSRISAIASENTKEGNQPFSDDDAEALMVNGDDLLNLHPDNITKAWKSWTRDYHKDNAHTAQQWQAYWEEEIRPRYLRRKAKQTRRASPEKTTPARSQLPVAPKRSSAPTADHSPTISPTINPYASFIPESPASFLKDQKIVSPKKPVTISPSHPKTTLKKDHSPPKPAARGSDRNPKSPTKIATAPSINHAATDILDVREPSLPSKNRSHTPRTPEKVRLPYHETLKRKSVAIEEDLPSSSPSGPISPKRRHLSGPAMPIEIASTPEKGRDTYIEGSSSPLFIKLELDEDEPDPGYTGDNDGLLGQHLSDTLSETGNIFNRQGTFDSGTPFIDFDVPAPEGGWDMEDLFVPNSSPPEDYDDPPAEDSKEDAKRSIREPTQPIDFDLLSPEGGWDEQETQVKEESRPPNTDVDNSQRTRQDTQAIFMSKTPAPDFSIADPDGGWNSFIASSPTNMPSSPRAESVFSQTDLQDQMDAWIDARATQGVSTEQVESVLKSTSMDTTLAHKALRRLKKKGALPSKWRGVWTEADDRDLKSTDARKIQRLQEKHGADGLAARWEFLDFYADEA